MFLMGEQSKQVMYSSNDVAAVSGASLRQLQWWDEQGMFSFGKRGAHTKREWSMVQLVEAVTLAALRRRGIDLRMIRRYWKTLRLTLERIGKQEIMDCVAVTIFANRRSAHVITHGFDNKHGIMAFLEETDDSWSCIFLQRELRRFVPRKVAA